MANQRRSNPKTVAGANISRIPETSIESEWLYVTAAQMEKWLASGQEAGVNRNLSELHISKLMNDMENDRWAHTHQGLAFDIDGKLRDGQHRGTAQVRLGQDRWWLVTRGLPAAAQHHMDSMRKRGLADFATGRNRNIRSSAARAVHAFDRLQPNISEASLRETLASMTITEVLDATDDKLWEKLDVLSQDAFMAGKLVPAVSASSMLAAATFALTTEEAQEWLRGFTEMSGLREGDPRIALIKVRGAAGKRLNQANARILALRCAVAWRNGENLKVLRPSLIHSVVAHSASIG